MKFIKEFSFLITYNEIAMKKKNLALSFGCLSLVIVSVSLAFSPAFILRAEQTHPLICADMVFGTTKYEGEEALKEQDSSISSLNLPSYTLNGVNAKKGEGTALKIGTASEGGSFTITFDQKVIISEVRVLGYAEHEQVSLRVYTNVKEDTEYLVTTETEVPDITDSSTSPFLLFKGLDIGNYTACSSLTFETENIENNEFNLSKLVFRTHGIEEPLEDNGTMDIYFLNLGNRTSGDCTYIKAGDYDILIDAGSTVTTARDVIIPFLDEKVTDGKLEYVIATHADSDHIYGFTGQDNEESGIFYHYEIDTLIDFTYTTKDTQILNKYKAKRDELVENGMKHYTAHDCYYEVNGGQKEYELGGDMSFEILYQAAYDKKDSEENNNSVCTLFKKGDKRMLFTGDSEIKAETSLVENNDLPEVDLFKAGHHGSDTSSNDVLLDVIKPKTVFIPCCAGDRYDFPHQAAIDRISKHTEKVYMPLYALESDGVGIYNGMVCFHYDEKGNEKVTCEGEKTYLKDCAWFQENRQMPLSWL